MHSRDGRVVDRVAHDYQRIVPDFRGDQLALPSDQGLHLVNRSTLTLTRAVGDMKNAMALSVLIAPRNSGDAPKEDGAPSKAKDAPNKAGAWPNDAGGASKKAGTASNTAGGLSRNLVVNMWDWNVVASWDDGESWAGWQPHEKAPLGCGEGGGGEGMGRSGRMVMFHGRRWWASADGGHNFVRGELPGGVGSFVYSRQAGSRMEPEGRCFALMELEGEEGGEGGWAAAREMLGFAYRPHEDGEEAAAEAAAEGEGVRERRGRRRGGEEGLGGGEPRSKVRGQEERKREHVSHAYYPVLPPTHSGMRKHLLTSQDFGQSWNWTSLPADLQPSSLTIDPTRANRLYALTLTCLSLSTDNGFTWSGCLRGEGLAGRFSKLLVKDSKVMFMLREGEVPLRTYDGGRSWKALVSCASLYRYGGTLDGSLSWSGETLVLHGVDLSAVGRGEYGTVVWKSVDDGESWLDETADLVTISPGVGAWYEKDFYLVTRGEGVTVKRGFEP
ncbi:MAG: hypothetical protein SGPRY_013217 [Prymnesium sp.]